MNIYREMEIVRIVNKVMDKVCHITTDKALIELRNMITTEICLELGTDPKIMEIVNELK